MIKDRSQAITRSVWFLPAFCLGLGVVVLAASWLGGQLGAGVYGLAVMAAFGLFLLLVTGRSETIRGLTVGRDERFAQIDLRATAVAGLVLIITLIVTWLVQVARGHSGNPMTGYAPSAASPILSPSRSSAGAAECRSLSGAR